MKRVFLLEDHSSFRETLALVLEQEPDLEVICQAGSLSEVRELPSERWQEVDVAIVDLLLPDGSGTEVMKEMREAKPDLPVVALTIVQDPEALRWARAMGADEVVLKDAPLEEILGVVRRALE